MIHDLVEDLKNKLIIDNSNRVITDQLTWFQVNRCQTIFGSFQKLCIFPKCDTLDKQLLAILIDNDTLH